MWAILPAMRWKDHAQGISLVLHFQLYERLLEGVRMLLAEVFEEGAATGVHGLSVEGGAPEYRIRVRLGLCGNVVLEFLFSGPGGPARCPSSGVGGGEGSVALAVIAFVQTKGTT